MIISLISVFKAHKKIYVVFKIQYLLFPFLRLKKNQPVLLNLRSCGNMLTLPEKSFFFHFFYHLLAHMGHTFQIYNYLKQSCQSTEKPKITPFFSNSGKKTGTKFVSHSLYHLSKTVKTNDGWNSDHFYSESPNLTKMTKLKKKIFRLKKIY